MSKSDREILEILEVFDATGCAWSAAELVGCDPKTVARYVDKRDAGVDPHERERRPRLINPFLPKLEEMEATATAPSPRRAPATAKRRSARARRGTRSARVALPPGPAVDS